MSMNTEKKVLWVVGSKEDKPYDITTWFRSVGIEEFVEKVEKEHNIVGVTFSGNNIGFVLDDR